MSIIRVTELDETTGLTSNSLFLTSYGYGSPKASKYITAENLQKYINVSTLYVLNGSGFGMGGVETIRIVNGPEVDTSYAPRTATLDFSGYVNRTTQRIGGSFYSTQTQTTTGTTQAMTFTDQDVTLGVALTGATNSEIWILYTGFYNLQFSAQIQKTQGGTAEDIYIWFRVNGQDMPNSNTKLTLANNGQFTFASWNIFLMLAEEDKVEIMWGTSDNHIELVAQTDVQTTFGPAIPSVIATITQI